MRDHGITESPELQGTRRDHPPQQSPHASELCPNPFGLGLPAQLTLSHLRHQEGTFCGQTRPVCPAAVHSSMNTFCQRGSLLLPNQHFPWINLPECIIYRNNSTQQQEEIWDRSSGSRSSLRAGKATGFLTLQVCSGKDEPWQMGSARKNTRGPHLQTLPKQCTKGQGGDRGPERG